MLSSVLALVALAFFPLSVQAAEVPQYKPYEPSPYGNNNPDTGSGAPNSPNSDGGSSDEDSQQIAGAGGGPSGKDRSGGGAKRGGDAPHGGKKSSVEAGHAVSEGNEASLPQEHLASSTDDDSSPLVPILIALAVLAAISIGVVAMRRRRQETDPGAPTSPQAN